MKPLGAGLAANSVADAVSAFGASLKAKLSSIAISGAPEDQLRGPLETLNLALADIEKLGRLAIEAERWKIAPL